MTDKSRESVLKQVWSKLRCPSCHGLLQWDMQAKEIPCKACDIRYPILPNGIPLLLLPEKRSHFEKFLAADPEGARMASEYRRWGTWRARMRNFIKPPSIVYDEDVARRYSWIYDTRGQETIILSIGGGPGRENPRVINLNIDAFAEVDIVGDGTNLPFQDESIDTVICNAVIEHIPNPNNLVAEIFRVLKPGGYAQMMIPFVFPFHGYPSDYQRYSPSGIAELTSVFEKVEMCVLTGPTSALLVMLREYIRLLLPGGNSKIARMILNGISGWITFPIKYLDRWLNRKPEAAHLAAAFFYVGRRPCIRNTFKAGTDGT